MTISKCRNLFVFFIKTLIMTTRHLTILFSTFSIALSAQQPIAEKILTYWKSIKTVYYTYDVISTGRSLKKDSIYNYGEAFFIMKPQDTIMYSDFYLHDLFFNTIFMYRDRVMQRIHEEKRICLGFSFDSASFPKIDFGGRACTMPVGIGYSLPAMIKRLDDALHNRDSRNIINVDYSEPDDCFVIRLVEKRYAVDSSTNKDVLMLTNSYIINVDHKTLLPRKITNDQRWIRAYISIYDIFTYDKIKTDPQNYSDAIWSCEEFKEKVTKEEGEQAEIFGKATELPFILKGDIYYNDEMLTGLRYSEKTRKYAGTIYTTKLDVPNTDFDKGFPGVSQRFENFEIDYSGKFMIRDTGMYYFRLASDDGSILYIDNKIVVNNDGGHGIYAKWGKLSLSAGVHKIRVRYYQAPRPWVALTLDVSRDDLNYVSFDMKKFSTADYTEKDNQVNVEIKSEVLFDFDSYVLKDEAIAVLKEMKDFYIDKKKYTQATIEGHTDDKGSEEYNDQLSLKRAQSVKDWLVSQDVNPDIIKVQGSGESKPKYPNDTDGNRAKNRRIEIIFTK